MGLEKKSYMTEELLKRLSLLDKADSYVRFLSGGMKKKTYDSKSYGAYPPPF